MSNAAQRLDKPQNTYGEVKKLLCAQFLTALADNAILFVAVAMVMQGALQGDWYVSALQGCFLVACVVLAPWVGVFADTRSKPQVLMLANLLKASGAGLMLIGVQPLFAYAIVGMGAAMYSPAKYGVLPELVKGDDALMKANSWVEGSTIVAILLGMVLGAAVADHSIVGALACVVVIYFISAMVAKWMHALPAAHDKKGVDDGVWSSFRDTIQTLLTTPRARFATLGVSLFWAAAVILRLVIIAWAPVVLMLSTSTDISLLTLFIALGIAVGALLAPRLIPMLHLRRARLAAYGLGLSVLCLVFVTDVWMARFVLFVAGVCGGLFVVPINSVLQDIGHRSVGSGHAVAVQHFFENIAMLTLTLAYTWAIASGASAVNIMWVLGVTVLLFTMIISRFLPPIRTS
ncbi:MAG: lysophospholipid transporter LplT [Mariprofundaceae bacterium]|nr:lysophospholipid transporter LplT [Mariprofundaceae bacterium]